MTKSCNEGEKGVAKEMHINFVATLALGSQPR
jgi:hypothetical protein